jgi:hypothetical protein
MRLLDWLAPRQRSAPVYVPDQPDRFYLVDRAVADGTGRAVVNFQGPPRNQRWDIETAGVDGGTLVTFYKNSEEPRNSFNIGEPSPNVLDRNRVYRVWTGERILVVFTGAVPGSTCTVHIEGARRYGDT